MTKVVPLFDTPKDAARSAAAWITLNPTEFTIHPDAGKNPAPGDHRSPPKPHLGGIGPQSISAPPTTRPRSKEGGATIFLQGRLAFLIYVTVGGARPDGQIKAWEWRRIPPGKEDSLALQVSQSGERPSATGRDCPGRGPPQGQKFDAIVPGVPVLPGQRTWVALDFPDKVLRPVVPCHLGNYQLRKGEQRINAHVGGRKIAASLNSVNPWILVIFTDLLVRAC